MTPEQMREMLKQTLEDYRLSRGERQALGRILDDLDPGPRALDSFRAAAFELARGAVIDPDSHAVIGWLEDVARLLCSQSGQANRASTSQLYCSPGDDCPRRIAGLFRHAQQSADVCVFTITDDRISSAILEAHRRGVKIRIISDNDKSRDQGSDIDQLSAAGVAVRVDRSEFHMHHKFAVFDSRRLLTGSYNWTRAAASSNEENFLVTDDEGLIARFAELFEQLWTKFG